MEINIQKPKHYNVHKNVNNTRVRLNINDKKKKKIEHMSEFKYLGVINRNIGRILYSEFFELKIDFNKKWKLFTSMNMYITLTKNSLKKYVLSIMLCEYKI